MPFGINKVALFAAAADTGTAVLLSTAIASSSASLSFTLPTAYKQVKFGFYNIAPATDQVDFSFQVNASGQTGYNETITSTYFLAHNNEAGSDPTISYVTTLDQAQGNAYDKISSGSGNAADKNLAGEMILFNPQSTTYVKHFQTTSNTNTFHDYHFSGRSAGYINVTAAITSIDFKMSSGNISTGKIKMWGIK